LLARFLSWLRWNHFFVCFPITFKMTRLHSNGFLWDFFSENKDIVDAIFDWLQSTKKIYCKKLHHIQN
jgi:hypothetical protein